MTTFFRASRRQVSKASRTRIGGAGALAMALLAGAAGLSLMRNTTQAAEFPKDLGGPERYLTHLSTDKPFYRPGETLYLRGVVLHALTNKPLTSRNIACAVEMLSPKGDKIFEQHLIGEDSVLGGAWQVPEDAVGGQYTLKLRFPGTGLTAAERTFDVRRYRAPRLKSQLEFVHKGYGPGDTACATLKVERAEGGVPSDATITAIARVDGEEVWRGPAKLSAAGTCTVSFELPAQIERGEGSLTLVIEDGGVVESASKTIPILLQTLDISVFPEGGDLVAGLECGLYVEGFTPWGDPADFEAEILDKKGRAVAKFATKHEGRGRGAFTPAAGESYALRVVKPSGIDTMPELPAIKERGVSLRSTSEVYGRDEAVEFSLAATDAGKYRVSLSKREQEVAAFTATLEAGVKRVLTLTPPASAQGVLRLTVSDAEGRPMSERLVYRESNETLNISVSRDRANYVPGDAVKLEVTTTDGAGRPVAAVVGLTVTDDSVLEMVEKRKQAPRLPVMAMLEGDVKQLDDARIYLSTDAKAPMAIDLLMGTQGWRRFAFADPEAFAAAHGEAAKRVLALREAPGPDSQAIYGLPGNKPAAAQPGWDGGAAADETKRLKEVDRELDDENAGGRVLRFRGGGAGAPERAVAPNAAPGHKAPPPSAGEVPAREEAGDAHADQPAADPEAREMAQRIAPRDLAAKSRIKRVSQAGAFMEPVRVYAHMLRANRKANDRADFAETLFWAAGIRTDAKGKASVEFALSDAVTGFRVMADGFTNAGGLGSADIIVKSVEPFYIEPKMPLVLTAGDRIDLPVALINGTAEGLDVKLAARSSMLPAEGVALSSALAGYERGRAVLPVTIGNAKGDVSLVLEATAGAYADRVTRSFRVVPRGFPIECTAGGVLKGEAIHMITVPEKADLSSISAEMKAYPTPLANLTEALEALIREPCGCFEQTSSSNYPLVMAQHYFKSHQGVDPVLIQRSNAMLEKGYQRLVSYECKNGGYDWFGREPAHEALTAYGVLQFIDMAGVYPVDQEMLARTRQWLLGRRDDKGNFDLNPNFLHDWGCPAHVTAAYIVWSLTEASERGLSAEIDALNKLSEQHKDPYFHGLVAASLYNAGVQARARTLAEGLVKHQKDDGCVYDAETTVTASRGDSLKIETTAIAALAWLKDDLYTANVEKAIEWLATTCKNGRFGSTQATVLALKAIVAYDAARSKPLAPGEIDVIVDGKSAGKAAFDTDTVGAIKLPDIREKLTPGQHSIQLRMSGGSPMPYSMAVEYFTLTPANSDECVVNIDASLSDSAVAEGESTEMNIVISNRTDKPQPMTTAIVGIPGGLELRHEKLKELVKANKIAFYEVMDNKLVIYLQAMQAKEELRLPVDLIAAIPGEFTGEASRAYLYYTDEHKRWDDGVRVSIAARR